MSAGRARDFEAYLGQFTTLRILYHTVLEGGGISPPTLLLAPPPPALW